MIAEFLAKNQQFTSIELKGNKITPHGFQGICDQLKKMRGLTRIGLDSNQIGVNQRGTDQLFSLVSMNPNIQELDLRDNEISDSSVKSIVDMIKEVTGLRKLDLRWNKIGE